jgi:phosphoglycerol transferase
MARRHGLIAFALTAVLSVGILVGVLQLWRADLTVPLSGQTGDATFYQMVAKSVTDNGWYLHNDFLSAPEGLSLEDFPITDTAHLAALRFLALWTGNYAAVLNLFFLLTFPLTAVASLYAFRALNVSYGPAIACSLLYTFLPYHFFRGEVHVFLAAYYFVPLMATLVLWMGLGTGEHDRATPGGGPAPTPQYAGLPAKLICVLVASAGTYYAFFGGVLLLVAAAFRARRDRALRPLLYGVALVGILAIVTVANLAPSVVAVARHGLNAAPIARTPGQAEYYGLKVLTLILPVSGHRIPALAQLKEHFNSQTLAPNENDWASLGFFGTIGFLMLLGWLVCRPFTASRTTQLFDLLGALNISALLLALTGGFAILVAGVFPEVRSYNRMSIYIAFFSLAALGAWLDQIVAARLSGARGRWAAAALVGTIVIVGIFDQTTPEFVPPYRTLAATDAHDAAYFARVEASLPRHAMIFELPYAEFPELHRPWGYELLRGYLHSRTLRWSYGAVSGRAGDAWRRRVTAQPLSDMVDDVALVGFDGVYVDRSGYTDGGAAVINGLSRLGLQPIVSADHRLMFFKLDGFRDALRQRYGDAAWRRRRATELRELGLQPAGHD